MISLSSRLLIVSALLLCWGCTDKHIYQVKTFKYYDESQVDVEVLLSSGKTQHFNCAFPPNTDFSTLKRVNIGAIKSDDMLKGTLYYCRIAP